MTKFTAGDLLFFFQFTLFYVTCSLFPPFLFHHSSQFSTGPIILNCGLSFKMSDTVLLMQSVLFIRTVARPLIGRVIMMSVFFYGNPAGLSCVHGFLNEKDFRRTYIFGDSGIGLNVLVFGKKFELGHDNFPFVR